jgi:riboflavin synthase
MFTGIVEAVGRVQDVMVGASGSRIRIGTPFGAELKAGDSVAVNGVCLTVVENNGASFVADVGPETARVTNLGVLAAGRQVNLERPMRLNGRIDGHLVLGHVDGMGRIEAIRAGGESHRVAIGFPASLAAFFVQKGSVAVDGVSLTLAALGEGTFDVQIVPYTWMHTTFSALTIGDQVNLECDMIGKYVVRAIDVARGASPGGGRS